MQKNHADLIKWLKILLYFQIAGLAIALIGYIPVNTYWCRWLQQLLQIGNIVCLFALASEYRYKIAAILGSVWVILTLSVSGIQFYIQIFYMMSHFSLEVMEKLSQISAVLNLIGMVFNWVYIYQLYHAHGDLVKDLDDSLGRKWRNLFVWSVIISILNTVSSMIFASIYANSGMNSQALISVFYTLIDIPGHIIILLSILCLYRTIQTVMYKEN